MSQGTLVKKPMFSFDNILQRNMFFIRFSYVSSEQSNKVNWLRRRVAVLCLAALGREMLFRGSLQKMNFSHYEAGAYMKTVYRNQFGHVNVGIMRVIRRNKIALRKENNLIELLLCLDEKKMLSRYNIFYCFCFFLTTKSRNYMK